MPESLKRFQRDNGTRRTIVILPESLASWKRVNGTRRTFVNISEGFVSWKRVIGTRRMLANTSKSKVLERSKKNLSFFLPPSVFSLHHSYQEISSFKSHNLLRHFFLNNENCDNKANLIN